MAAWPLHLRDGECAPGECDGSPAGGSVYVMQHVQWIRWQVNYLTNPKTQRCGWKAKCAFPCVVLHAKALGMDGFIPFDDLEPENLATIAGTVASTPSDDECVEMLEDWLRVGYLERFDNGYMIPSWPKHKPSVTGAERQRRYRERRDVTLRNGPSLALQSVSDTDGTGREGKEELGTNVPLSTSAKPKADERVREVFDHWVKTMGKRSTTKFTTERRAKIRARLKTYSADDLKRAIDSAGRDPFTMGDNDRGKPFNDILTIFRNDTKVEGFLDTAGPSAEGGHLPDLTHLAWTDDND